MQDDLMNFFSSLALLWYHTILCPFFASSGNGEKVKKQLEVAEDLLTESPEYRESALFLYFEGRLNRIKVLSFLLLIFIVVVLYYVPSFFWTFSNVCSCILSVTLLRH